MSDTTRETTTTLDAKFDKQGLLPAIVQDIDTRQVLMMGWMNREALRQSLATRKATFFSRSRQEIWVKGQESGHVQEIVEARVDCDQDVVLLLCRSHGPACHVGYRTCFYRVADAAGGLNVVEDKVFDPDAVYAR